jgi:hypothetical protein
LKDVDTSVLKDITGEKLDSVTLTFDQENQ